MKYLTSIDLTKNQLLNAALHNNASAPSSPVEGQVYFNTVDKLVYYYNGTLWIDISTVDLSDLVAKAAYTADGVVVGTGTDSIPTTLTLTAGKTIGYATGGSGIGVMDILTSLTGSINANAIASAGAAKDYADTKQSALTFGIANTNSVKVTDLTVSAGDYAMFTATGVEGKTKAEVISDLAALTTADLDTDVALVANSDSKIATQKATKAYVDGIIAAANALTYKGVLDCSTNPNYPAGDSGDVWVVSVAGKVGGASGTTVDVGDMVMCKTDGTPTGTEAIQGSKWNIVERNIVGAVTGPATSTDVAIAVFDGTTGKVIKDSTVTVASLQNQNVTHTGDATGATALTVVALNGTNLAALSTGLLKNTTATGVPSIAVAGTDFVAPGGALGTPTSGTLTNCAGLPAATGITGIIGSTNGGVGNGFTKVTGPTTAEKTFTLPDASATILTTNDLVTVAQGGTGAGTITGLVKGNGTDAFTGATAGSDYLAPGGALSTPSSGTLTNCAGLPAATGLTGILGSSNGGTGNGFAKFTGPTTAEKTFTLPDASATILTTNAAVTVAQGGTGVGTLTGIVMGNGTSNFTSASAGTDYVAPGGALGTPSSGTLTNCGGTAASLTAGTCTTVPALSGDITTSGSTNATTIGDGKVTLAKMATLAASSIIGNKTGGAATPTALSPAEVRTLINVADGATANLGTVVKYATNIGDGALTTVTVTHNLGTRDVTYSVYEAATPYAAVMVDCELTTINTITLYFAVAPTSSQYRVVVTA